MLIYRLTAVTILGLLAWGAGTISAQYPPPTTSTECDTLTTAGTNAVLPVTAEVVDAAGDPVEGALVSFEVLSQPGTSAFVDPASALTNVNGIATSQLHTGSALGTIEVGCGGTELVSEILGTSTFAPPVVGSAGLADKHPD